MIALAAKKLAKSAAMLSQDTGIALPLCIDIMQHMVEIELESQQGKHKPAPDECETDPFDGMLPADKETTAGYDYDQPFAD
jgi:hypothetical protein